MTPEQRYSLRAACWGVIFGAVACEALHRAGAASPAYWIVASVATALAVGWLADSTTRDK